MSAYGHLLKETVYVAGVVPDGFGGWMPGPRVPYRARIEGGAKLVRDRTGVEVVSTVQFVTDCEVPLDSRVWLPGEDPEDDEQGHVPIQVTSAATLDGRARLWEVAL